MGIKITRYNIICNLGVGIDEVFKKAVDGVTSCFEESYDVINSKKTRLGKIGIEFPDIPVEKYNLRCNKILLKCFEGLDIEGLIKKYGKHRIGVVAANTNAGVQEFEFSQNEEHAKISNPAFFIKDYFGLNNYCSSVSTACSSGIKAFSIALDLINSEFSDAVIVAGVDELSKVPIFGFDSLEILSGEPSNPFSKNRSGMNIGEGAAVFVLEKGQNKGVEILGIGETTDTYHSTTPDPEAVEAVRAIEIALETANLSPNEIDYINLHGTGTLANDLMEANAINKIFGDSVYSSSIKPMTGHCLGAAASIETALCCKLIENKGGLLLPHIFDGIYDEEIPKIRLVKKGETKKEVKRILCTSFGFGGTNAAMILGAADD